MDMAAKMRKRLNDADAQWWSDDDLHDAINAALAAVSHRLMPWKRRWVFTTSSGVDTYSIPEDFAAPISLFVGGAKRTINGIESALQSESDEACGFIDNDALILYPLPQSEETVVLNYHAISQAATMADLIKLPTEIIDVVMNYALSIALLKPATEESVKLSKFYLDLYEVRCKDAEKIAHQRRNAVSIRSKHQKV